MAVKKKEKKILIISGSMFPSVKPGWIVEARPANKKEIKIGDIVVFGRHILTCHRLIGKINFFCNTYYIHKGDNAISGGVFEEKDLIGKVVAVRDENRRVLGSEEQKQIYRSSNKIAQYIYLLLYLMKKFILPKKCSKLLSSLHKFLWRYLS